MGLLKVTEKTADQLEQALEDALVAVAGVKDEAASRVGVIAFRLEALEAEQLQAATVEAAAARALQA